MEFQFNKTACRCLRTVVESVQTKEETQEVRISDGLPDIGRLIGCWGQPIVRGKEWRSDEIRVSSGVMAWVAYAPEDGSAVRCVETWIPFQFRWDLADSQRDGQICVVPMLSGIDCRSTSARKLMVRAAVTVRIEALEATETPVFTPDELPEDIQLLRRTYPVELPQESGEKLFQIEEVIKLPAELVRPEKILHYTLTPEVTEQKIMANRLVFRGNSTLYMLYTGTDGMLHTFTYDIPFSQYTDLDRDYGPNATAWVMPVVTSLELTRSDDDTVSLTAGIATQYVIYDRQSLEMVEDAYSTQRAAQPIFEEISLPVRLDMCALEAELACEDTQGVAEVSWLIQQPAVVLTDDAAQIQIAAQYQKLYYDDENNLQSANGTVEKTVSLRSDQNNILRIWPRNVNTHADSCNISADAMICSAAPMVTVCGLQTGECKEPDPNRPSLILCRGTGRSLWDVAKKHGSTVSDIMSANGLNDEQISDKILLIPVK